MANENYGIHLLAGGYVFMF